MEDSRLGPWGESLVLAALPLCYVLAALPLCYLVPMREAGAMALLAGAALWLMGRATGSLVSAFLAQSAPFLPPVLPEPLLVAAIALLMVALMPLARGDKLTDSQGALAGAAIALSSVGDMAFALLAVVPVLLFDRRRFVAYGTFGAIGLLIALAVPAAAAAAPVEAWGVLVIVDVPIVVLLGAYVRMRRRGLMARDRRARLATGILAAQALVVAAGAGVPALLLAGPALALLWPMSRCLGDARLHRRLWLAGLAVLAVTRLAQTG